MKIVFFDGVCGLCNHFVDFIIKYDREKKLYFSPLQGGFIKKTQAGPFSNQETIVFLKENQVYIKSRAIIEIIASLGTFWVFFKIFLLIPPFIRDFFYHVIAKNRYSLFGKNTQCRMPTEKEKNQFLE
jgi:predicted DCC family thiol-disulfide oxidoreductase YuxK